MTDEEPNLVTSGKSCRIVVDGCKFSIDIYRREHDTAWTLEVIDHRNTSHVWDGEFSSDAEARDFAVRSIDADGPLAFLRSSNVIPIRRI